MTQLRTNTPAMPRDLSQYIPVICKQEDAPKFNEKLYMEPISMVLQLNGLSIPAERHLTRADFSTGDEVLIRFKSKDYRGVVDFSCDDSAERDNSPGPFVRESQSTSATFAPSGSPLSKRAVSTSSALPGSGHKRKCVDDPQCARANAAGTPPKRISKNVAAVGKSPKRISKRSNAVGNHRKQIANADGKSPKHTGTPRKSRKPGE